MAAYKIEYEAYVEKYGEPEKKSKSSKAKK